MRHSRFPFIATVIVLVFFYLPIGFLVLNSFNDSRYASKWKTGQHMPFPLGEFTGTLIS